MTLFKLSNSDIDAAVEEAVAFLRDQHVDSKDILRIRLGVEEALLRSQDRFGQEKEFTLKTGKPLGKLKVSIAIRGDMFDPFSKPDNAESDNAFMRTALSSLGDLPVWRYNMSTNTIAFGLAKKQAPDWVKLVVAIAAGLILGFLLNLTPPDFKDTFATVFLSPLINTFMGLLSAISGPMIALAVVWGIYSIGDAAAFSNMGKRLIGRYLFFVTLLTLLAFLIVIPFFDFVQADDNGGIDISSYAPLFQMLLDIIPNNIVLPFSTGNTLQILFVSVVVGLALVAMGEKTQTVAIIFEQINLLVQMIMDVVTKLVPFFIFGCILNMMLGDNSATQAAQSYKMLLCNVVGIVLFVVIYIALVAIQTKTSPLVFVKKALPSFTIALTTASSAAAFASNIKTCTDDYGIAKKLANFGVPFGQVIYKPGASVLYATAGLCMGELFGVPVSLSWFVSLLLISILLSIATPPIPGGTLASCVVLFAQLGIPSDGIAIVMAMNIILDFLDTPVNLLGGQTILIMTAKRFSLLDEDTLRAKKK